MWKQTCVLCGTDKYLLCKQCKEFLTTTRCHHPPIATDGVELLYSPYCYSQEVGKLVRSAKTLNSRKCALALAEIAHGFALQELPLSAWDFIIPIPPRWSSTRKRGFHLPLLFADRIAKVTRESNLTRQESCMLSWRWLQHSLPQKYVTKKARSKNIENCFHAKRRNLEGCSVLIVDDVLSTGSTLQNAARALRHCAPDRIEAFCLAHSHGDGKTST